MSAHYFCTKSLKARSFLCIGFSPLSGNILY